MERFIEWLVLGLAMAGLAVVGAQMMLKPVAGALASISCAIQTLPH